MQDESASSKRSMIARWVMKIAACLVIAFNFVIGSCHGEANDRVALVETRRLLSDPVAENGPSVDTLV